MAAHQAPTENPYASPSHSGVHSLPSRIRLGQVGFAMSLLGVTGVCLAGVAPPAMCLALLCVPGLLVSFISLVKSPGKLATWGVALGALGCLYVPTICLALFVHRHPG